MVKKKTKKTRKNKKRKMPDIIVTGASGVGGNITKMAEEMGGDAALDFAKRIQEDKRMEQRMNNPWGLRY